MILDKNQLLEDTDNILSLIKVNTYSDSVDVEKGLNGVNDLYNRINATCIDIDDVTQNDGIVTLEVNGMVLAACVLTKKRLPHSGENYYLVSTMCSIDATMLKAYVLREAERFALKRDVFLMKINVMFIEESSYSHASPGVTLRDKLIFFRDVGYTISPDVTICTPNVLNGGVDLMLELVSEIKSYLGRSTPVDNLATIDNKTHVSIFSLMKGVIGDSLVEQISVCKDNLIKWNGSLIDSGISSEVEETYISMWKCLKETAEIVLPGFTGGGKYHTGSVVETLELEMDRFLDVVRINTHSLQDSKLNMEDLYTTCRGGMDLDYLRYVFNQSSVGRFVTTVEVSGVPIAFSVLKIHECDSFVPDLPTHDIYHVAKRLRVDTRAIKHLEVELICSSEFSGLGRHLMKFAEAFAIRNSIDYITLQAVPSRFGWYRGIGFQPGAVSDIRPDGNDRGRDFRILLHDFIKRGRDSLRDINAISPRLKNPIIEEMVISVVGNEKYDNYRGNHPDQLEEWNERLERGKSIELIDSNLVTMSRSVR